MNKGSVLNIQRYSLHDGPGIRTVIFLKGCPLVCQWCCNPESQQMTPTIVYFPDKCLGCNRCFSACPTGSRRNHGNDGKCTLCGKCVDVCPVEALQRIGSYVTIAEIMDIVEKDRLFYETSGGGVTLSGGEVLNQWKFALNLLQELHRKYYHTAIETTGFAPWEHLKKVLNECDLVLYDLKHMNSETHKSLTGVPNELILENARKVAAEGKLLIFRIPLLGGLNTNEKNIQDVADFAVEVGVKEIHILPYHRFGESKYKSLLNSTYSCKATTPDETEQMKIKGILESKDLLVKIGG